MSIVAYLESNVWKPTADGQWLEAPCTLITEGVHAGSHGAIYHSANVLAENAHKWQNIPLTLGHPRIGDDYVSVNFSPEVFTRFQIGEVVNPRWDEDKKAIRASVRIPANHPQKERLTKLKEVSVGVFTTDTNIYGQWFGENYSACSISHEPDHLALLPEGHVGACDYDHDGCGMRVNNLQKGEIPMTEKLLPSCVSDGEESFTVQELQDLQEAADHDGFLLPGPMNVNLSRQTAQRGHDDGEMLLPPGVE
jgi:hypothetical protein